MILFADGNVRRFYCKSGIGQDPNNLNNNLYYSSIIFKNVRLMAAPKKGKHIFTISTIEDKQEIYLTDLRHKKARIIGIPNDLFIDIKSTGKMFIGLTKSGEVYRWGCHNDMINNIAEKIESSVDLIGCNIDGFSIASGNNISIYNENKLNSKLKYELIKLKVNDPDLEKMRSLKSLILTDNMIVFYGNNKIILIDLKSCERYKDKCNRTIEALINCNDTLILTHAM